jgi:hypothetical protein
MIFNLLVFGSSTEWTGEPANGSLLQITQAATGWKGKVNAAAPAYSALMPEVPNFIF